MDYKKLYYLLFNAATDALRAMEEWNMGQAKNILREAQCTAEEMYLSEEDEMHWGEK